jgi:hypothetical protein
MIRQRIRARLRRAVEAGKQLGRRPRPGKTNPGSIAGRQVGNSQGSRCRHEHCQRIAREMAAARPFDGASTTAVWNHWQEARYRGRTPERLDYGNYGYVKRWRGVRDILSPTNANPEQSPALKSHRISFQLPLRNTSKEPAPCWRLAKYKGPRPRQ